MWWDIIWGKRHTLDRVEVVDVFKINDDDHYNDDKSYYGMISCSKLSGPVVSALAFS